MSFRKILIASCLFMAMSPAAFSQKGKDHDTTTQKGNDHDSTGVGDLMDMLGDEKSTPKNEYTTAIFKATRIINGHSIQNVGRGVLDFRISHRFGVVNNGIKDFFGLDGATTRLGFDYGITDWLMIGIGRSTFEKEVDGIIKAKLLKQKVNGDMPVSVSVLVGSGIQTAEAPVVPDSTEYYFHNRVAYTSQLLIARKFSSRLSLQLMPSLVHYNLVPLQSDPNNVVAIGIGGRLKLSHRISLTGEWYYTLPGCQIAGYKNALSFGIDIETGGHVFQLLFTNSTGNTERTFIGETKDSWSNGGVHFGFNISRVFTVVKPKDMEGTRNKIW